MKNPNRSQEQSPTFRVGVSMHFRGSVAVKQRLLSAGMHATKVEMYRGIGETWVAETERGRRWVSHTKQGWKISKAAPVNNNRDTTAIP